MIRFFISVIRMIMKKDDSYLCEKWSKTHNVSTVLETQKQNMNYKVEL
ncbi:MAG: hypothetical protein PUC65_07590 [Clostridiales bacterium]|nr:hypothetical protein [Clostridiales bacterium]